MPRPWLDEGHGRALVASLCAARVDGQLRRLLRVQTLASLDICMADWEQLLDALPIEISLQRAEKAREQRGVLPQFEVLQTDSVTWERRGASELRSVCGRSKPQAMSSSSMSPCLSSRAARSAAWCGRACVVACNGWAASPGSPSLTAKAQPSLGLPSTGRH